MIEQAKHILKSVFGYDCFISLQQDVIANVLRGKDTLAVMPTGGGKSLCYQIPALILDGLTIVVSPLISLMKDQVEQLAELAVPAVLLNSALSPETYRGNVERLRRREAKLLYVAPETLLKTNVRTLLEALPVACLAIDEAHCISEWGPDFRPEYRQLAEVRAGLPRAACIALTATATPKVRQDIKASLGFDDASEFIASFNRENLFIQFTPKEGPYRQATTFLKKFPNESGIVYCLTRKQVDELCAALRSEGFSACPYHAGLSETERTRNQEQFARDEVRIIVATIAFGMGINKSNIRFVLHYDLPKSIESYYQEIGRAGRDGMRAECLLLYSYGDIYKIKTFSSSKEGLDRRAANLQLNAMLQLAEADGCRRVPLLRYFGEAFSDGACNMCDNCLAGEREKTDVTIPAQKFLSCVKRTGECFGAGHIIDVLLGSKASKISSRGHDRLSTYGIGKEYTRKQWQQLARQLLHQGLMAIDPDFGGLSLTPRAWEVFKGREVVFGRIDAPQEEAGRPEAGGGEGAFQYDQQLFERLRQKRKELADAAKVPPYVIFSDRTLAEMAAYFPRSSERLLAIHGIGEAKLDRYGPTFIAIIEDYCRKHAIVDRPPLSPEPPPIAPSPGLKRRHTVIAEAYDAGQSVASLAEQWNVKPGTILDHLYKYHQEGYPLRAEGLLPAITVPEELRTRAMAAFKELGPQFLRPVFEALNEEIGYDELKAIRLYYLTLHGPAAMAPTPGPAMHDRPQPRKIICLANSRKYSGCCIAGKELLEDSVGKWIRPVSGEATGELSVTDILMQNGAAPKLLDIVSIPLKEACPHAYQSENHRTAEGRWVRNGGFPFARLPELCDEVECLWINGYHSFNGRNDRMPLELARTLSSSLLFIRPEGLSILVAEGVKGLKKIWSEFTYRGETYRLTVTDPAVEACYMPLAVGSYPVEGRQPYLTVSISEPFEGFCYKLVAAIILPSSGGSSRDESTGSRNE